MDTATEGYRIFKPSGQKITHLLYIDDLKFYATSEEKLRRVARKLKVKSCMKDIGLHYNERKCSVLHVKRDNKMELRKYARRRRGICRLSQAGITLQVPWNHEEHQAGGYLSSRDC